MASKITPRFYNTASRQLEEFVAPSEPVTIYTCGPTVYHYQHIGNYLAYVYWDILVRLLLALDYPVKRVMNITDVGHLVSDSDEGEDKIEKGARATGKSVWEVADFFANDFLEHFAQLKLLSPNKLARATDYIDADMALVDRLTAHGLTYETSDGVYYDTSKFPRYADFARLDLAGLEAGKRVDFNPEKRHVSDFALWKFVRPGEQHEMQWQYLGQPGYPGWHLECASIILAELGESITIHTGGVDHIPVHHSNEIAEVEPLTKQPLARYWLHNNHAMIDGTKISKSLGNVVLFPDLIARGFSHLDFKAWVYAGHYQKERNFTWEDLAAAQNRRRNWHRAADLRWQKPTATAAEDAATFAAITTAVADNLTTSSALTTLEAYLKSAVPNEAFWSQLDQLFGLDFIAATPNLTPLQSELLAARQIARRTRDFALSDQLRDQLAEQGIAVLDSAEESIWYHL